MAHALQGQRPWQHRTAVGSYAMKQQHCAPAWLTGGIPATYRTICRCDLHRYCAQLRGRCTDVLAVWLSQPPCQQPSHRNDPQAQQRHSGSHPPKRMQRKK